ncbi:MAG: hypothetical protein J3Q66DRAFT_47542 [Benniella sp.]|nr:MAG: hypothetical protein J3Q66DRAFT_47542 [Benniella sp.]
MTLDMATYSSLLQSAKAVHDLGDLKTAFATYLKAHTVIIRILQEQVVFKNQDSIESVPDNYVQLIAHGQEILRRIKDIMTQSSASSSSTTSRQSKATPSLSPSPSTRPGLTPQTSQRSIATTSQINKRTKKNVPLIPISPLTKQMLLHSHSLSQVTQRFEQAKQGSGPQENSAQSRTRDLAQLRRLTEDVRIQRARLDAVNTQIQSVASSTIISWDPDTIARQLTIIDLQLFKDIAIPKDLVRADRKTTCVQHCIDFETFVAHSVAHMLLIDWDAQRQLTPANSSTNVKGHTHIPVNAVAHMIRVAYILLNVYRNMNSFMAIMRTLTSPEITRMHKSWSGVNSKVKELYRRMAAVYRAQDSGRNYKETLLQKLDAFQDVGKDALVAIPWMRYHLNEVRSIVNSYLTGQNSADGSGDVVLSAPGARKLSAVSAVLTQCRTNETSGFDRQDMDDNPAQSRAHSKQHREPVLVDGIKLPLTPILDLMSLSSGDIALHHWLLSRPFLNKQQLIDESLEIEPLLNGEELACYDLPFDNSNCDDIGSVDEDSTGRNSFERVIAPERDLAPSPQPQVSRLQVRPPLARDRVSESDVNSILSELLKDDASDNKGLFDDVDDEDAGENSGEAGRLKDTPEHSRDVLQFLGMDPDEHSDSDDDNDLSGGLTHKFSNSTKDKGKAPKTEDSDEINDLLARVKGLVQESRNHMSNMEFNELDLNTTQVSGLQDNQNDQPDHGTDHRPSDPLSRTESPSMLSLEALRRQLDSLDQEASTTGDSKASNLIIVNTTEESKSTLENSKYSASVEGNGDTSGTNGGPIPTISIVELDKLAALFRHINVDFTLRINGDSDDDSDDDGDDGDDNNNNNDNDQFSCNSSRFRGHSVQVGDQRPGRC